MSRARARTPLTLALAGLLALAACGKGEKEDAAPDAGAAIDTLNDNPLDGVSQEQIQRQATPMTPEQAEQMGIVDTTIHVENLENPEVLELPPVEEARGAAPKADSTRRPATPPAVRPPR